MARLPLAVVVAGALGGCGILLDLDPPDPIDAGPVDQGPSIDGGAVDGAKDLGGDATPTDLGVDAPSGPCVGHANGDLCSSAGRPRLICLNQRCVGSTCGDGFVDTVAGEECDPLTDADCNARTCHYDCRSDSDCAALSECLTAACVRHSCTYVPDHDGTHCMGGMGTTDVCSGGLCTPPGCGDGMVETGEDCDPSPPSPGCTGCHFDCTDATSCTDGDPCNGVELCAGVLRGAVVVGRTCTPGAALVCATTNPCERAECAATDAGAVCANTLIDADGDGFAPTSLGACGTDCDDTDPNVHPGAIEACNGVDDDCNGVIDDHTMVVRWCLDGDGDGYGDPTMSMTSCAPPSGPFVRDCSDCWDSADPVRRAEAATVNPGQTGFFTMPYCPAATGIASCSYDYNCDTHETQEDTTVVNCGALAPLLCASGVGWQSSVPACGAPGTFATCHGVMIGPIGLLCRAITVTQPQACN